jgi:hypothetical protein
MSEEKKKRQKRVVLFTSPTCHWCTVAKQHFRYARGCWGQNPKIWALFWVICYVPFEESQEEWVVIIVGIFGTA